MAADMSVRLGWIEEDILHRTVSLLGKAELPTRPPKVPLIFPCTPGASVPQAHDARFSITLKIWPAVCLKCLQKIQAEAHHGDH